jgi:hypothetical protein
VKFRGFPELPAPFLEERRTRGPIQSCVQEIRGISLVFREMWDTAGLPLKPVAGPTDLSGIEPKTEFISRLLLSTFDEHTALDHHIRMLEHLNAREWIRGQGNQISEMTGSK